MRYIHPVQMHEKFVASGEYHLVLTAPESEASPVRQVEAWAIHEHQDGGWMIRCDRHTPDRLAAPVLLGETLRRADGDLDRIDLRYFTGGRLTVEISYTFEPAYVSIGRRDRQPDGTLSERDYQEIPLPAGYVADGGVFAATRGLTVQQLANRQAQGWTTVPLFLTQLPDEPVNDMSDLANVLTGGLVSSQVRQFEPRTIAIGRQAAEGWLYEQTIIPDALTGTASPTAAWTRRLLVDADGLTLQFPVDFAYAYRLTVLAKRQGLRPESKSSS